ncbi:MAG: Coq4 family protein [Myxococcales bacterium]|nr:Coq4 family protein [Myxococcales bacterium]
MEMEVVEPPRRRWMTPADVWRAMRALGGVIRDADRTDLIGEFIAATSGDSGARLYDELMADPEARAILEEGRDLEATLNDREALAAMPPGSLGRTYYEWTAQRDFDAAGIADAIRKQVPRNLGGPFATMAARVVDQHDLWHVLNGWDSDIHGEVHLLGFSYAQLGGRGWWILGRLAVFFLSSAGRSDTAGYFENAIARGHEARTLAGVDWEAMLPLPLEGVRGRLGIDEPAPYERLDQSDAKQLRTKSPMLRILNTVLPA